MNPVVSSNYKPQRLHIRFGQDADPPKQKLGLHDNIVDPQPPEKVVYFDEILKTDDPHLNALLQCGMEGRPTQGEKQPLPQILQGPSPFRQWVQRRKTTGPNLRELLQDVRESLTQGKKLSPQTRQGLQDSALLQFLFWWRGQK
jgi:hypothetical protein